MRHRRSAACPRPRRATATGGDGAGSVRVRCGMGPAPGEAGLEAVVLGLLDRLGWSARYGPEIAPGELAAERGDYREVVLTGRLRDAIVQLNPDLPLDAVED